jgi:hypothetical protein
MVKRYVGRNSKARLLPPFRFTSPPHIPRLYILSILYEIYITKNILLETLVVILSNDIIFILYNLYYIDEIDYLGIRGGLVNRNGGSSSKSVEAIKGLISNVFH